MLFPLILAGSFGAWVGSTYGRTKGFISAMAPLTTAPGLEASYRKALGPMSPQRRIEFEMLLNAAREERAAAHRHPASPMPPASTGAFFLSHGYRQRHPPFYAPYEMDMYGAGGGIFNAHGYRPWPPPL